METRGAGRAERGKALIALKERKTEAMAGGVICALWCKESGKVGRERGKGEAEL